MSDLSTEQEAENILFSAVMGSDTQDVDKPQASGDELDIEAPDEVDGREAEKPQAKQAQAADPEDDYIEVPPTEEGGEPQKLKVADVLAGYQEYQRFEGQKTQILDYVERQAVEQANSQLRAVRQQSEQAAYAIHAALQLLQPPQPPNPDMLDPQSQSYNPDRYHQMFATYQRTMGQFQQAQAVAAHLQTQARQAQTQAQEVYEQRELQRVQREWPEIAEPATLQKFVGDMQAAYGFTFEELDGSLTDARQIAVCRDALAYRAMKAQSGKVKTAVEAKPKIVRTKQEAKGGQGAQSRDTQGKFVSDARARLAKTNSDDDAAAFFAGLVKAGRI